MKINYNDIKGVIHVGANTGQETRDSGIKFYHSYNLNVIWVEPILNVYNKLQDNIKMYVKQRAFNALITDVDGQECDFFITNNNGESSSIFELNEHKRIWPTVHCTNKITITSKTLSSLLYEESISIDDYNLLNMDTQGSELLVLKGCVDILPKFKYISLEVADFASYKNGCKLNEIEDFLVSNGFKRISLTPWNKGYSSGDYYDALYERL